MTEPIIFDSFFADKLVTNQLKADVAALQNLSFEEVGVTGDFSVNGTLTVTDDVEILGGRILQSSTTGQNVFGDSVMGNVTATSLTVSGTQTFSNLEVAGNLTVNGTITQTDGTTQLSNTSISSLTVTGPQTISSNLVIDGILDPQGGIQQSGAQSNSFNQTTVTDINVLNTTELNSTTTNSLTTNGAVTMTGPITQSFDPPVFNQFRSSIVNGYLECTGSAITQGLEVNGSTTLNNVDAVDVVVDGNLSVSNDLTVADVLSTNTLAVSGSITSDVVCTGTLDVAGSMTLANLNTLSIQMQPDTTLSMGDNTYIIQSGSTGSNTFKSTDVDGSLSVSGNLTFTVAGAGIAFADGTVQTTAANNVYAAVQNAVLIADKSLTNTDQQILTVNLPVSGTNKYYRVEAQATVQNNGTGGTRTIAMILSPANTYINFSVPNEDYKNAYMMNHLFVSAGQSTQVGLYMRQDGTNANCKLVGYQVSMAVYETGGIYVYSQ
jgi:hypothetical protein